MTAEQALNCIESKDWMRARTVDSNRVDAMFRAIKDPRKFIGRILAFYYYYKFIRPWVNFVGSNRRESLLNLIPNESINDEQLEILRSKTKQEILRYCYDESIRNGLQELIARENEIKPKLGFFNNDDDVDEELVEEFDEDYLTSMEKDLRKLLSDNEVYTEDLYFTEEGSDKLKLFITIDGDWKHDHLLCDNLVEDEFCKKFELTIEDFEDEVIDEDGSDSYESIHMWVLKEAQPINEEIIDEEDLEETYSDEELDKLVGKTFNQQKIQSIYRRQKYNDKRLFAHTKCIKCGREKRVFLSNLINDPDKYGSCVCSDENVKSRLDNIQDLYDGSKRLSSNTSGYTGVSYIRTYQGKLYDKWRAYIEVDGKRTYLGDFSSKSAAVRAREKAAKEGIKWYKAHKNDFMKDYRKKSKWHRALHTKKTKKKKS